jgi:hypothetical protein
MGGCEIDPICERDGVVRRRWDACRAGRRTSPLAFVLLAVPGTLWASNCRITHVPRQGIIGVVEVTNRLRGSISWRL